MSMFRSPNDESTSDPESSSDGQEADSSSLEGSYAPSLPEDKIRHPVVPSLQHDETASESIQGEDGVGASPGWLPSTAEQHAALLTTSLLEFAYNVRAAEHLNHAQSTARFHHESPEARALGAVMYQGASRVLASNGIIIDNVHVEEWREMRRQYIIGVDNLGFQAFNESMTGQPSSSRGVSTLQNDKMLISRTSPSRQAFRYPLSSGELPGRIDVIAQHRAMVDTMVKTLAVSGPNTDIQIRLSPSVANTRRYQAEFRELKRIGKGGFGTVYHVNNFVDNQDYAVKKIPLDSRRLRGWQRGGTKDVEALLKEIRTLARLEHSNIVRYYAAWIEVADWPTLSFPEPKRNDRLYSEDEPIPMQPSSLLRKPLRKQLPMAARKDQKLCVDGCRAVREVNSLPGKNWEESTGVVFGEDSDVLGQPQDSSPAQSPMRRGKKRLPQVMQSDPSPATSFNTETDIFTDGEGEVRSEKSQMQNKATEPIMVLHIQMSLHPLTLSSYLSSPAHTSSSSRARHCFHLGPSLRLIRAILSGVEYLHSQGIVHRDIKPGNIFLSEHGENDQRPGCVATTCTDCKGKGVQKVNRMLNPRIGDFGLVADVSGVNHEKLNLDGKVSNIFSTTEKVVGTEFYRPPSATGPQKPRAAAIIDEKLDVFALGVLLFELLWKMETRMERHMLLTDLSKKWLLPDTFAAEIYPAGRRMPVNGEAEKGVAEWTVGECVADCVKKMVCPSAGERWGCRQVRERLDQLMTVLDGEAASIPSVS